MLVKIVGKDFKMPINFHNFKEISAKKQQNFCGKRVRGFVSPQALIAQKKQGRDKISDCAILITSESTTTQTRIDSSLNSPSGPGTSQLADGAQRLGRHWERHLC